MRMKGMWGSWGGCGLPNFFFVGLGFVPPIVINMMELTSTDNSTRISWRDASRISLLLESLSPAKKERMSREASVISRNIFFCSGVALRRTCSMGKCRGG